MKKRRRIRYKKPVQLKLASTLPNWMPVHGKKSGKHRSQEKQRLYKKWRRSSKKLKNVSE